MQTQLNLGSTKYTLRVIDLRSEVETQANMQARIDQVKTLHAKYAKTRKASFTRNTGGRVFPPNGANVSVKDYCEQYYRANSSQYGVFSRETLDFFEPLSVRRCYAQGEYFEEVCE